MDQTSPNSILLFAKKYAQAWYERHLTPPRTTEYVGMASDCILSENGDWVEWQAVERLCPGQFDNIEVAMEIALHPDIKRFYGSIFCADMPATVKGEAISLIQVWSEEDFVRLQENMLGHLFMQKKLKQSPTMFIASTNDEQTIISICNHSGSVLREKVGTRSRAVIAGSLDAFLTDILPKIN